MKRGCEALVRLLVSNEYNYVYVDDLCYAVSIELIRDHGRCFRELFLGLCFWEVLTGWDIRNMRQHHSLQIISVNGEQAIERRGKARPGQKTMLDASVPGVCGNEKGCILRPVDITEVLERGYQSGTSGSGRTAEISGLEWAEAENFKEKTLGLPDPGAVSVSLLVSGVSVRSVYE